MAELTYNEQLMRAMVAHQIGLLRFSGSVRNAIWKLLDATEADMREQIARRLRRDAGKQLTPAGILRVQRLIEALRETRAKAWKQVDETWFEEMRGLALAEPGFTVGIMQSTFPVDLGMGLPDAARLRAIVKSTPFMGATLGQWADKVEADDIARIERAIKIGLTQGEDVRTIARRVVGTVSLGGSDGATAIARREAEAITRTAVNAIASEARRELFAANADLLTGEIFLATLDSRTTPICRSLDGKVYEVGEGPVLPLHFNERSLLNPIVDGEVIGERPVRNFTEQQLLREFAAKEGLRAPKKRVDLPRGTKASYDAFKRKRMRELTGTVPAKVTYQEFLKGQGAEFQNDLLGPTRGALFRKGNLTLDNFVMPNGRELTLSELAEHHAAAFRSAGLDPKLYV